MIATRTILHLGLAGACLSVLTTCCPTLTLQATSRDPAPWPGSGVGEVSADPIPVPEAIRNRFEVAGCDPARAGQLFDDYLHDVSGKSFRDAARRNHIAHMLELLEKVWTACATENAPVTQIGQLLGPYDGVYHVDPKMTGPGRFTIQIPAELSRRVLVARVQTQRADAKDSVLRAVAEVAPMGAGSSRLILRRAVPCIDQCPVTVWVTERPVIAWPALSFIHLSDVQLRDSRVKLGTPEVSSLADRLIPSFEHDEDQEFYGRYVFEALIATINAAAAHVGKRSKSVPTGATEDKRALLLGRRAAPRFVIHTGDAVDAGVEAEFKLFHYFMDRLLIPWFDVIGNHDVLVYGNLLASQETQSCVTVRSLLHGQVGPITERKIATLLFPNRLCVDSRIACETSGSKACEQKFIARARYAGKRTRTPKQEFIRLHRHDRADLLPALTTSPEAWRSHSHGLDLNEERGYYHFTAPIDGKFDDGTPVLADRKAVFIVLNTSDLQKDEGGASGRVGGEQLKWLQSLLRDPKIVRPQDLVFAFAHHSLGSIRQNGGRRELIDMLSSTDNFIGFFYGHDHRHGICRDSRPDTCSRFWEIETASIIEFPQEARLVTIKSVGRGLAYIELISFGERLDRSVANDFTEFVERGKRGAERDFCRTHAGVRCSEDEIPRRADGDHTYARLFFKLPGAP